jgi:hypothetical protein
MVQLGNIGYYPPAASVTNEQGSRLHVSWYTGFCGLVVRVPGYRSRGPGFNSRRYQIF